MGPDPVIDEIRRVRREISAEHGNDPARILEYYTSLQARLAGRLVDYGGERERRPEGTAPAPRPAPA
ncbi:MAG: hypothetical protein HYU66_05760 [Armatimonadetes bacterium]|nr:hypothetical protein [Armatimonadota bacterium]